MRVTDNLKNLINHVSNENFFNLENGVFYFGIDPTGAGLHIGHLVAMMLCLNLLEVGCKGIVLVGNFTASIGDPTGKAEQRSSLDNQAVNNYASGIFQDLKAIFGDKVTYVYNNDWLGKMTLAEYIRYSEKFSVNKKLSLQIFDERLKNNNFLSVAEFTYSDLQAIDFYYLNQKYGCNIQIGGQDQWGNIAYGTHFVQTMTKNDEIYGVCTRLVLDKNGKKLGKSEGNAIFLRDPWAIYQYIINMNDDDSKILIKILFNIDSEEGKETRLKLIKNLFKVYHHEKSEELFEECVRKAEVLFNGGTVSENDIINVDSDNLIDVLLELGFVESKSDAKRKLEENCIYLNKEIIKKNIQLEKKQYFIELGKKKKAYIKVQ